MYFRMILSPLEKGMALSFHLNKLEFPSPMRRWSILPSLVNFEPVVVKKMIKMWKVNWYMEQTDWQTADG